MRTDSIWRYAVVILSTTLANLSVAQPDAIMKAAVAREFGGPEVLRLQTVSRPQPKEDETLIKVIAAGVNPVDAAIRAGKFHMGGKLPLIPGMDIAGLVEKCGAKVTKFKVGDAVYSYLSLQEQGGYAQFAIAKENETARKPRNVTFDQAAAVPLAATTAWEALVDVAKLSAGQTILIHGGSGGVGHFAIQIAKARGAKVIATASTPNLNFLKELGADQQIDYTTTKFENVVKDVDVVLDAVRSDALEHSYGVVKKGGIIVSITGQPDPAKCAEAGIRGEFIMAHPDAGILAQLTTLIEEKKVVPTVSETFSLAEAAKAHAQIETHHTRGKIVLKTAEGAIQ